MPPNNPSFPSTAAQVSDICAEMSNSGQGKKQWLETIRVVVGRKDRAAWKAWLKDWHTTPRSLDQYIEAWVELGVHDLAAWPEGQEDVFEALAHPDVKLGYLSDLAEMMLGTPSTAVAFENLWATKWDEAHAAISTTNTQNEKGYLIWTAEKMLEAAVRHNHPSTAARVFERVSPQDFMTTGLRPALKAAVANGRSWAIAQLLPFVDTADMVEAINEGQHSWPAEIVNEWLDALCDHAPKEKAGLWLAGVISHANALRNVDFLDHIWTAPKSRACIQQLMSSDLGMGGHRLTVLLDATEKSLLASTSARQCLPAALKWLTRMQEVLNSLEKSSSEKIKFRPPLDYALNSLIEKQQWDTLSALFAHNPDIISDGLSHFLIHPMHQKNGNMGINPHKRKLAEMLVGQVHPSVDDIIFGVAELCAHSPIIAAARSKKQLAQEVHAPCRSKASKKM